MDLVLAVRKTLASGRYFCQRLPRTQRMAIPEPRNCDLEAHQGYRRTAGSLDAAEAIEPTTGS